jgi:NADH-quinone oxidoreductase subunit H
MIVLVLIETGRTPFDVPDAEAEVVSGWNTEYSGIIFALFYIGEYLLLVALLYVICLFFLGGSQLCIMSETFQFLSVGVEGYIHDIYAQ